MLPDATQYDLRAGKTLMMKIRAGIPSGVPPPPPGRADWHAGHVLWPGAGGWLHGRELSSVYVCHMSIQQEQHHEPQRGLYF